VPHLEGVAHLLQTIGVLMMSASCLMAVPQKVSGHLEWPDTTGYPGQKKCAQRRRGAKEFRIIS